MALGPLAKLAAFRRRKPPASRRDRPRPARSPERPGDDDLDDDGGGQMSFLDHLDELRRRLVAAALSLAVGTLVAFFFIDRIFDFIMRPLYEKLPAGSKLIYTEPTEAFMLYVKIALLAGVVIAAPLIMWQLWLFIAPGLYAHEKRFALPFILMASVFFVGRRGVQPLRAVPVRVGVPGRLHDRLHDVHAAHRAGVLALRDADAGHGR